MGFEPTIAVLERAKTVYEVEKLTVAQVVETFQAFYGTGSFITVFTREGREH
jgi:hypothetical protein